MAREIELTVEGEGGMGTVFLGERADDKIGGYSGGMRQRVAVARALAPAAGEGGGR